MAVLVVAVMAQRGFRGRASVAWIDLGTTNSVICVQRPSKGVGAIDCVEDPLTGSPIIPSVVSASAYALRVAPPRVRPPASELANVPAEGRTCCCCSCCCMGDRNMAPTLIPVLLLLLPPLVLSFQASIPDAECPVTQPCRWVKLSKMESSHSLALALVNLNLSK